MKRTHLVLLLTAAALTTVMLTDTLAQRAPSALVAARVAVCDMPALSANYNRAKDIKAAMAKRGEAAEAESQARKAKINQLREGLSMLEAGTPAYQKQLNQLDDLIAEYDAWVKKQSRQAGRIQEWGMRAVYEDIRQAIADVARAKGAHIVMSYENDPPKAKDLQELMLRIQSTEVLFNDGTNDITEDVLKRLNAQYAKEAAGGADPLGGM